MGRKRKSESAQVVVGEELTEVTNLGKGKGKGKQVDVDTDAQVDAKKAMTNTSATNEPKVKTNGVTPNEKESGTAAETPSESRKRKRKRKRTRKSGSSDKKLANDSEDEDDSESMEEDSAQKNDVKGVKVEGKVNGHASPPVKAADTAASSSSDSSDSERDNDDDTGSSAYSSSSSSSSSSDSDSDSSTSSPSSSSSSSSSGSSSDSDSSDSSDSDSDSDSDLEMTLKRKRKRRKRTVDDKDGTKTTAAAAVTVKAAAQPPRSVMSSTKKLDYPSLRLADLPNPYEDDDLVDTAAAEAIAEDAEAADKNAAGEGNTTSEGTSSQTRWNALAYAIAFCFKEAGSHSSFKDVKDSSEQLEKEREERPSWTNDWRFNKAKQNWLIKHLLDFRVSEQSAEAREISVKPFIPAKYIPHVCWYLKGIQGRIRGTLIDTLIEARDAAKIELPAAQVGANGVATATSATTGSTSSSLGFGDLALLKDAEERQAGSEGSEDLCRKAVLTEAKRERAVAVLPWLTDA